jgi:putative oxidoreductase
MKNKLLQLSPLNTDFASLLLRLIFGGLFMYHGYDKIDHYHLYLSMSKDLIGIGTKLSFDLVIFAEFFCGLLVTIGFLTRLTVIPIFITMSIAFLVAHSKDAFMVKELPFLFLLLSMLVFVCGSGKYSLDQLIFRKK